MHKYSIALLLFLLAPPLPLAAAPLCVTDDSGARVCLEAPAKRIIPLYASFSEILADLGLAERIIARTASDEVTNAPGIGTHIRPNLELAAALAPDLVLQMSGRGEALQSVEALRRLGVTTALFKVSSFAELFSVLQRIGVLTGTERQAAALQGGLEKRLAVTATALAEKRERPTVFFELRYPNLLAAGPGAMATDIIRLAGGTNCVSGTADERVVRISEERLIALDPDVYLLQLGPMNKNPPPLSERAHFATLKSGQSGRVLAVEEDLFSRPGPRNINAVELLAAYLHPDLFPAAAPKAQEQK
jgi:iron complex transport system substrate-binding protein